MARVSRKGSAMGGPLDGLMLEAGSAWDGRVEKDLTGFYRWDPIRQRWTWALRTRPVPKRVGRPNKITK